MRKVIFFGALTIAVTLAYATPARALQKINCEIQEANCDLVEEQFCSGVENIAKAVPAGLETMCVGDENSQYNIPIVGGAVKSTEMFADGVADLAFAAGNIPVSGLNVINESLGFEMIAGFQRERGLGRRSVGYLFGRKAIGGFGEPFQAMGEAIEDDFERIGRGDPSEALVGLAWTPVDVAAKGTTKAGSSLYNGVRSAFTGTFKFLGGFWE